MEWTDVKPPLPGRYVAIDSDGTWVLLEKRHPLDGQMPEYWLGAYEVYHGRELVLWYGPIPEPE